MLESCIFIMTNHKNTTDTSFVSLDEGKILVEKLVEKSLSQTPLLIRPYTSHFLKNNGKYIRAKSLLTCAQNLAHMIPKEAIDLAAAIEILHLATLVHDDIIDQANVRRGIMTLHKKYDQKIAVICGDYLFCLALQMVSKIKFKEKYKELDMPNYMARVCFGELSQHIHNGDYHIPVYQYLKIIAGKTAALFEASFYGGGVLGEEPPEELKKYKKLGWYVGMIFQLSDDCIDFEETEKGAKKPVQSDFEQGVITLPLIHVFEKREELRLQAKKGRLTGKDITMAVKKYGGLDYTRMISGKYYNKALKIIENLQATKEKKERLQFIVHKAYRKVVE